MNNTNNYKKILNYILPWITILHIYKSFIPGVSLGYLTIIIFFAVVIIKKMKNDSKYEKNKIIVFYLIYSIVFLLISLLGRSDFILINILNKVLKYSLVILFVNYCIPKFIDKKCFLKSYTVLVYFSMFALITQFATYTFFSYPIEFKIPFLHYYNDFTDSSNMSDFMLGSGRFTSLFTEPSHFIYFISPYLAYIMFNNENYSFGKIFEVILVTLCMLLCVSSSAIFIIVLLWSIYFFRILFRRVTIERLFLIIFIVFVACVGVTFVLTDERIYYSIFRLSNDYGSQKDVWYRLIAGAEYLTNFTDVELLIGVGLGNDPYVFMNGIFYSLYVTGIIGCIVILLWFTIMFLRRKNNSLYKRVIVIIAFLLHCIDVIIFTPMCLHYYVLLNAGND